MPRVTDLCRDLAERFQFEESKVLGYSRVLREAGMLTTGARGVNAPDATSLDAARLLIVMMVRAKKEDAADAATLFGGFVPLADASIAGKEVASFEGALSTLIDYCGSVEWDASAPEERFLDFDFAASILRDIAVADVSLERIEDGEKREFRFVHPSIAKTSPDGDEVPEEWLHAMRQYRTGFHEVPSLYKRDLLAIGQVLAGWLEPGGELQ
mgnify:CR=1 FL=1|tara:strand:- start:538 stop:1173 length:636 start_codon:yes stop_codon:yes gene_type:complete